MKRLSIFLAAIMACTVSFAVDFKKVTTAPTDWSGEYLLVYENSESEAFVWNGVDAEAAYDKMAIADGKITANASTVTIKIASMEGGFSLSLNGGTNNGKYVGQQSDKNGFVLNASALVNTIAKTEEGVDIVSAKAHIRFNNATTNGNRFRYYKSSSYTKQQPVQLYKKVSGVEIPATGIALDKTALELTQYESATLKATLTPADATTDVVWKSSDEKVATVANGVVTAVGEGTATITAAAGELTATCAVTVKEVTPITCAEAVEIAKKVSGNNVAAEGGKYVIRGYVTKLAYTPAEDMEKHGNYSAWMADTKDGGEVFMAYQAKPVDGKTIATVGDYVEVVGDITKYTDKDNNTTYETMGKGNATIKVIGGATAVEEVEVAPAKAVKVVENGQLIIIRDGVRYNAVGAVME